MWQICWDRLLRFWVNRCRTILCSFYRKYWPFGRFCRRNELYDFCYTDVSWHESLGFCCDYNGMLSGSRLCQWSSGIKMQAAAVYCHIRYMTIARGIAQIVNGNYNTDSIGEAAKGFRTFFYSGNSWGFSVHSGLRWQYGWYLTIWWAIPEQAAISMRQEVILMLQDFLV